MVCLFSEATYTTGFGITVHRANSHDEDGEIDVIAAMIWYHFPLCITYDMARLLRYVAVCPKQWTPFVLLVYEHAKLLESYFQVRFKFEVIIQILYVTEYAGSYYL